MAGASDLTACYRAGRVPARKSGLAALATAYLSRPRTYVGRPSLPCITVRKQPMVTSIVAAVASIEAVLKQAWRTAALRSLFLK